MILPCELVRFNGNAETKELRNWDDKISALLKVKFNDVLKPKKTSRDIDILCRTDEKSTSRDYYQFEKKRST